jgi:glycine/D-amino acid oxidase-like deaminating enzyme
MPILGPTAVPNLFLATGQYMDGILLAPIMAQTITELVQTGVVPELIQPFGIGRFQRNNDLHHRGHRDHREESFKTLCPLCAL